MAKKDYYEVLGVGKTANADEFVKASDQALTLTNAGLFVTIGLQHPVLASASAGLFCGGYV
ncbi:MAG TPA: hypothetical protein VK694_00365 [Verrucomicrobiae bacterium]|nr:hypothetical protein [Verrucomicrobiae bacterium]